MEPTSQNISYLVMDIETVPDGELIAKVQFPGEDISAREAVSQYQKTLMQANGTDFVPVTFHLPICIVVAKVTRDYYLTDIAVLDQNEFRPETITRDFWRGWEAYQQPTIVTFNGRSFDMPVLELAAFRYGISLPKWFMETGKSFEKPRYRYNSRAHLDLHEMLTNFGSIRFNGGLDLAASLLNKPGKMHVSGNMVQKLYDSNQSQEIANYCTCDVLDTYFVFLRSRVLVGDISFDQEQDILHHAKTWASSRANENPGIAEYLTSWDRITSG